MSSCYRCFDEFDRVALLIEMDGGLCHVRCLTQEERKAIKSSHLWSAQHLEELERIEAQVAAERPAEDRPGIAEMLQAASDRGLLECQSDAHRRLAKRSTLAEAFLPGTHSIEEIARYQEGVFCFRIEEADIFEFQKEGENWFLQLTREEVVDLFWELSKVIGDDPTQFQKGRPGKLRFRVEVFP